MNSFDWKWRECLLAVSVTKRLVKFFDNERQFLNYQNYQEKKFQLLLIQELAIMARAMTTAKPGGVGNGITTVISDALHGSYFFVSAPAPADEQATRENSGTAVVVSVADAAIDEGRLKKVKRRKKKKKRGRTKRNRRPSDEKLDPIWSDVPVVVWDPLQMSPEENPPREPRSVAVAAARDRREGPSAAASQQLLIAVEETSSPGAAAAAEVPPPLVPRLIDGDVEVELTEEKGPQTPTPVLRDSDSSDGARAIVESVRLPDPSNTPLATSASIGNEMNQTEVQASSLQAESPPTTVEVAATIEVASQPIPKEDTENIPPAAAPGAGSTKQLTNEEGELDLEARNGTAAPPELPSHLKVLNFNFKEGVADDTINLVENDNQEENVIVVLPAEAGSSSEEDLARPPFVLLASTVAPSTTTTTTTTDAPTLPPTPSSATLFTRPTLPPASAGLLEVATPTAAAGSVAIGATVDPIRTGMKIIQSSTLFVPSSNPGKND